MQGSLFSLSWNPGRAKRVEVVLDDLVLDRYLKRTSWRSVSIMGVGQGQVRATSPVAGFLEF